MKGVYKNILVTGASGQLGSAISEVASGLEDRFVFTDISGIRGTLPLDITDAEAVGKAVDEYDIDIIINCAAYTDVERAEDDLESCRRLNAIAPGILASAMKKKGGLLVQISTDYVFGGDFYNTPCREDREGTPTGVYGRTKLEGERNVIRSGCRYLIIRTAWMYSETGHNFVKTILSLISSRPELKVVFDQAGTPTYARDLAEAICSIIGDGLDEGNEGIYHYSGEGVCSWFDFARMIASCAGNTSCDIRPCRSGEFPSKVVRPSYSVLDKTKIKETFGLKIPYWTDSLEICVANLLKNDSEIIK